MKIKLEDLSAKVTETLLAIRAGVEAARNAGLIAELPEKVDFQIEVVTGYKALEEEESNSQTSTQASTSTEPEKVSTTVRSGGGQTDTQTSQASTNTGKQGTETTLFSS